MKHVVVGHTPTTITKKVLSVFFYRWSLSSPISSTVSALPSSTLTKRCYHSVPTTTTWTTTTATPDLNRCFYQHVSYPLVTDLNTVPPRILRNQFPTRNRTTSYRTTTTTMSNSDNDTTVHHHPLPPPIVSLDLSDLSTSIVDNEKQRQEGYDTASKLKVALAIARHNNNNSYDTRSPLPPTTENNGHRNNINNDEPNLSSLIQQSLQIERTKRPPGLTHAIQDYIRLRAYRYFLTRSDHPSPPNNEDSSDGLSFLLPPSSVLFDVSTTHTDPSSSTSRIEPPTNHEHDEDYLLGIMGLTQDLSRFAVSAGTERNADKVLRARNLVRDVLEYLLTFDFRNGVLRRKYDGVKYALKTCETVLYELSVTGCLVTGVEKKDGGNSEDRDDDQGGEGTARKRHKTDPKEANIESTTPTSQPSNNNNIRTQLEQLRQRVERRDDLRETLIKRCRDAQKKAKQAVYALHRDDYRRADDLITECERIVTKDLVPIVEESPVLRFGSSLGGVLEEYAEAVLFRAWILGMEGKMEKQADGNGVIPRCALLPPRYFIGATNSDTNTPTIISGISQNLPLSNEEYLGGLCDLTGEIGRYAVRRGTVRDSHGVKRCLDTVRAVLFALETMERFPSTGGIGKKMDPLRFAVEKLERMRYELSLVEATGRSIVVDSVKGGGTDERGGGDDDGED